MSKYYNLFPNTTETISGLVSQDTEVLIQINILGTEIPEEEKSILFKTNKRSFTRTIFKLLLLKQWCKKLLNTNFDYTFKRIKHRTLTCS